MKNIKLFGFALVALSFLVSTTTYAQVGLSLGGTTKGAVKIEDGEMHTSGEIKVHEDAKDDEDDMLLEVKNPVLFSSAEVKTDGDLEVFNTKVYAQNKAVTHIEIESEDADKGDTEVVVSYKHTGKFLGFIPVTFESETTVEAQEGMETKVNSKLPWWTFLVTGKNYNEAKLESQIKNNQQVQVNAKAHASANAKARVAEAIVSELEANANLEAQAK